MASSYRERLTLRRLAGELSSSPRQIQRAYEECGAGTFREDLRERRMQAAEELLSEQPSLGVAQIARLVGYAQAPHFARAFRAHYGLTPGQFRARAVDGPT